MALRMSVVGGVAALLGGLAWVVKGAVILAGGGQPQLLFEVAPALFGVGLLGLTRAAPHRRPVVGLVLAGVAVLAGLVAAVTEIVGDVAGVAIAASCLAVVVGLVLLDRHQRWPTPLAWWIGATMLPAVFVGGLLSGIDERLLEVPIIGLGVAWTLLGWALLRASAATDPRAGVSAGEVSSTT